MQRTICGKLYDTETATLIAKRTEGSFGDDAGYEEILYKTPEGNYFLFGSGGKDSPYPVEKLVRISEKRAKEWQEEA